MEGHTINQSGRSGGDHHSSSRCLPDASHQYCSTWVIFVSLFATCQPRASWLWASWSVRTWRRWTSPEPQVGDLRQTQWPDLTWPDDMWLHSQNFSQMKIICFYHQTRTLRLNFLTVKGKELGRKKRRPLKWGIWTPIITSLLCFLWSKSVSG